MTPFVAVDWGTTNRRAYQVAPDGTVPVEHEDGCGILSVADFPRSVAELAAEFDDLPMLMAGMIGSNRGWREAPYVAAPAGLDDLAAALTWITPRRIAIVPGVSWQSGSCCDVMRGEEVQALGAAAVGAVPADALLCLPGTHNKWVRLEGGRVATLRTVMTGEVFNLLRQHSLLADMLTGEPDAASVAFASGVEQALTQDNLLAELFSVRARVLLGVAPPGEAVSYVSGLLIGSDIRAGVREAPPGAPIAVVARSSLTKLFAAALRVTGREAYEIDGKRAFIAGLRQLAERVL